MFTFGRTTSALRAMLVCVPLHDTLLSMSRVILYSFAVCVSGTTLMFDNSGASTENVTLSKQSELLFTPTTVPNGPS
jgi:hypothetical protein